VVAPGILSSIVAYSTFGSIFGWPADIWISNEARQPRRLLLGISLALPKLHAEFTSAPNPFSLIPLEASVHLGISSGTGGMCLTHTQSNTAAQHCITGTRAKKGGRSGRRARAGPRTKSRGSSSTWPGNLSQFSGLRRHFPPGTRGLSLGLHQSQVRNSPFAPSRG
jgi:hypothetical protein